MDFLPLPVAVDEIRDRNAVTSDVARKALIATFMLGEATAVCDAYWRTATVGGQALPSPAPDENGVPCDFWHLNHACSSPVSPGYVSSGYSGEWSEVASFRTEICLSSEWAAVRFPEFRDLRRFGGQPVDIQLCAMDVRIFPTDLEALIERGKARGKFKSLIEKAKRKPSIVQGNVSKSDAEKLWARLCCNFLTIGGQNQLAQEPDKVLEAVRMTASHVSQSEAVSDRMMRRIAKLIAEEARLIAERRGPEI